jgi:hypothetical protein
MGRDGIPKIFNFGTEFPRNILKKIDGNGTELEQIIKTRNLRDGTKTELNK